MRIYIIEEYSPSNELTRYWLFDCIAKTSDFLQFCKAQTKYKDGFTYLINISDPNDRR